MEWSIQEVAKLTVVTSRTLRHYGDVGLLAPSRVGAGGHRYYDRDGLVRLQRILLLRELGLSLHVIAEVLSQQSDTAAALGRHIEWLRQERDRIDRQIASVRRTLTHIEHGGEITMEAILDGFDHARYDDEVRSQWGEDALRAGNLWWNGLTPAEQQDATRRAAAINGALRHAAEQNLPPDGDEFQRAVADHPRWLADQPTPVTDRDAYLALAELYVSDERFAATYGGPECARRIRQAVDTWVARNL